MTSSEPTIRQPKAVLCDVRGVAKLLASDLPAVLRELGEGRLPRPLLVCGQELWRIAELRYWVVAGCPDRATWERRTTRERALPAKRRPDRQAPAANGQQYDNFKIPRPGKSVFAWVKTAEKMFNTKLVDGMARDGDEQGCGRQFADWNEAQVNTICLKVIAYIRELPTYEGQFDHLFADGSSGPPWTLS